MCISVVEEIIVASEGALQVKVPDAVTNNVQFMGPLGQVARGALTARRITQSNNPIVWTVEAAALTLDMSGNLTASKVLRMAAAGACYSAYCLTPHPLVGMAGLALTNGLLEEEAGA
jgi:hypothetical protein